MLFSFQKIFKQAFEIAKNNKFLWLFGLFLVLGNYPFLSLIFRNHDPQSYQRDSLRVSNWLDNHLFWSNIIFLGILIGAFILVLLYFQAKAANIAAIKAIIDKQQTDLGKASRAGLNFRGRLIGVSFLLVVTLLLIAIVLGAPIIYLFVIDYFIRALVLMLLALIIFTIALIMASFIDSLASMYVVLFDQKILESIKASFLVVVQFWPKLILFGFWLLCISLTSFFISLFVAGLIGALFVLFAFIFYDRGGLVIQSLLPLSGLIVASVVFLITQAVVAVFGSASWVLLFLKLVKPEKLEEKSSAVSIPEVVS